MNSKGADLIVKSLTSHSCKRNSRFSRYRLLFVENKADCRVSGACSALDKQLLSLLAPASRLSIERGNAKSYGSTIIKRQSSKTEREGTLDSGQLRGGADRPSGPNAVWNKQFRPPGNHQQHRGVRKSGKGF